MSAFWPAITALSAGKFDWNNVKITDRKADIAMCKGQMMAPGNLNIYKRPKLSNPRLLLGFSGWMDGGRVSTGTVKCLIDKLGAQRFAEIEPEGFYIYSFPGSMELTALFRPYTQIKDGLIEAYEVPADAFYYDEKNNLVLFLGKEPNLRWETFAECIYSLCEEFGVKLMYFIGSIAGLVPHTREPRFLCSFSDAEIKKSFERYGVKFTNYEGPASFVTLLTANAHKRNLSMAALVATIPAYVQGDNPRCIEAVTRRITGILELQADLDDMRKVGDDFEKKLDEIIQDQPELADNIRKLEEDYDNEIFDSEMDDLKRWLQEQGIRVD